jgi:hypothetical protein
METPLKTRSKAKELLVDARKTAHNSLIIHYSCESLDDKDDGRSPRITSIAIRRLDNAQTVSFSLHKIAEKMKISYGEISGHFDQLETQMLKDFFDFVSEHKTDAWIHWNMRSAMFGFHALGHRYEVLGGKPVEIHDKNKIDLARCLSQIYGSNYIGHPRFPKIVVKNSISTLDMLTGQEEADAFVSGKFLALHNSTLRKVNCFEDLMDLVIYDRLKHEGKIWDLYGPGLRGVILWLKDYPYYTLAGIITTGFSIYKLVEFILGKVTR